MLTEIGKDSIHTHVQR